MVTIRTLQPKKLYAPDWGRGEHYHNRNDVALLDGNLVLDEWIDQCISCGRSFITGRRGDSWEGFCEVSAGSSYDLCVCDQCYDKHGKCDTCGDSFMEHLLTDARGNYVVAKYYGECANCSDEYTAITEAVDLKGSGWSRDNKDIRCHACGETYKAVDEGVLSPIFSSRLHTKCAKPCCLCGHKTVEHPKSERYDAETNLIVCEWCTTNEYCVDCKRLVEFGGKKCERADKGGYRCLRCVESV